MTLSESRGLSLLLLLVSLALAGGAFGWWMMRIPPGSPNEEGPSVSHAETAHRRTPSAPSSPAPSALVGDNDEAEAHTEAREAAIREAAIREAAILEAENSPPAEEAQPFPSDETEPVGDSEDFAATDQEEMATDSESEPVPGAWEHRGARITTRARQIETLVVAEERARSQLQEAEAAQDGQRVDQLQELLRQLSVRRTLLEEAAADSR